MFQWLKEWRDSIRKSKKLSRCALILGKERSLAELTQIVLESARGKQTPTALALEELLDLVEASDVTKAVMKIHEASRDDVRLV